MRPSFIYIHVDKKPFMVRIRSRRDIFTVTMLSLFSHLNKSYSIVITREREGQYNGSFFKRLDLVVPPVTVTSQSDFRLTAWRRQSSCRGPGSVRRAQRPGTSWWPLPVLPGSRPSPEQTTAGSAPAQTPW